MLKWPAHGDPTLHKGFFESIVWQTTWLVNQNQPNNFLSSQLEHKELTTEV